MLRVMFELLLRAITTPDKISSWWLGHRALQKGWSQGRCTPAILFCPTPWGTHVWEPRPPPPCRWEVTGAWICVLQAALVPGKVSQVQKQREAQSGATCVCGVVMAKDGRRTRNTGVGELSGITVRPSSLLLGQSRARGTAGPCVHQGSSQKSHVHRDHGAAL